MSADKRLAVQELNTVKALDSLAGEWSDLWLRAAAATPFQHPAWLIPWTRNLWGGGKLFVLAVRDGERLLGVAPLFQWGYPGTVQLSWLGAGITDYTDLLAGAGDEDRAAAAVLRYLHEHGDWAFGNLEEVPAGSAILRAGMAVEACSVCPVARLAPTLEEQLAELDGKFRTDLRRAENRLRRAGELRIEENRPELLDELFRLHADRWQERGEAGVLAAQRVQQFHREAAAAMAHAGLLRLYGLFVNDECIAVQHNMAGRRAMYAYLAGFDPAWAKHSPGAVLLKHAIGAAMAEGFREFDFLRQPERFKYDWGARDRTNYRLRMHRGTAPKAEAA